MNFLRVLALGGWVFLAAAGGAEEQELPPRLKSALLSKDLDRIKEIAADGCEPALAEGMKIIFDKKEWSYLGWFFPRYCFWAEKEKRFDDVMNLSCVILRNADIKDEYTVPAWKQLLKLSDAGHRGSLEMCIFYLINPKEVQEYGLQKIIQENIPLAEEYAEKLVGINPASGYFWMGIIQEKQKNPSEAYRYFEKGASQGELYSLKRQIHYLKYGVGVAPSESMELYCRYMALSLDSGKDEEWSRDNRSRLRTLEENFQPAFAESLKVRANLDVAKIREWNEKNSSSKRESTSKKGHGTGFFITKNGYLLTAAHVVSGSRQVQVGYRGERHPATVISMDEDNDVAILKTDPPDEVSPLSFASQPPSQGDPVSTYGYPTVLSSEINDVKYDAGTISSLWGIGNDPKKLRLNLQVLPGNSGGPLLDASNNVIGMVVELRNWRAMLDQTGELSTGVSYAVKNEFIKPLLEINKIKNTADFSRVTGQVSDSVVLIYVE